MTDQFTRRMLLERAALGGAAPELRLVGARPEPFGEQRPLVRRVLLGADGV